MIITWVLFLLYRKTHKKIPYSNWALALAFLGIWALVVFRLTEKFSQPGNEVEASWFPILNSFYIITLAPLFTRWWESKYNPSGAFKYGYGLMLQGLGFGVLVFGTLGIPPGAHTASVNMIFLILAYLFITMGELCLSPLGLSYLSKLVPPRMIGFMFGIWYLALAIGQKSAGTMGGMIDKITAEYSLSAFFGIFSAICIALGVIAMLLNPLLSRLMHGVR
jgi:POT family proton-dependent oligopeptide transporter